MSCFDRYDCIELKQKKTKCVTNAVLYVIYQTRKTARGNFVGMANICALLMLLHYSPTFRLMRQYKSVQTKNHTFDHTCPNTEKRVENRACCGVFLTHSEEFENVVKHCLSCLMYLLHQNLNRKENGEIKSQKSRLIKIRYPIPITFMTSLV